MQLCLCWSIDVFMNSYETTQLCMDRNISHLIERVELHSSLITLHHEDTPIYFDPFKPRFNKVKPGFTGVYIIFLILLKDRLCVLIRTALPRKAQPSKTQKE